MPSRSVRHQRAACPGRPGAGGWPGASTQRPTCEIRVELGRRHTADDIRTDLASDATHWLAQFRPRVGTTADGRTEILLCMHGADAWGSTLTTMALLRQAGYDLRALHVVDQGHGVDDLAGAGSPQNPFARIHAAAQRHATSRASRPEPGP